MTIKRLVRRALYSLGYELRRIGGDGAAAAGGDLWTWLRVQGGIRTVIDIGANNGEFAEWLAGYFNAERTIAIEPLPDCAGQVRARPIRNLEVIECAVSDQEGRTTLYENAYAPASSLLPVSRISSAEFPQTAATRRQIEVQVRRLDDLVDPATLNREVLIKIDVQGVEDKVIRGGERVFCGVRYVLIEMSFVPMYDGQPLFEEVHAQLVQLGFRLAGIKNQIDSPATGQPLFIHCLYINAGRAEP